jgi:N-methylhydantoinase A
VTVERGRDPREFTIVAFGGNGPLFAAEMAAGLGVATVLVPPAPGVFSALGLLEADLEHHLVRTFLRPLEPDVLPEIAAAFAAMEGEATRVLATGLQGGRLEMHRALDLRYAGQSYELTIPLPAADPDLEPAAAHATLAAALRDRFAQEHERTYGHASADDPTAIVNIRLTARVVGRTQRPAWRMPGLPGRPGRTRRAWFGETRGLLATPVIGRDDLDMIPRHGPLLVDEYDATTLVPPGATAVRDEQRNIVITTALAA